MQQDKGIVSLTALTLAAEIKTIYENTLDYVFSAEAKLMEKLWLARKEFIEDDSFTEFIQANTPLKAEQAISMVITWDAARQNRQVREIAQRNPSEAIKFIKQLTDDKSIVDDIVKDEPEVAKLLAMNPRNRAAKLKQLIQTKAGHHPADKEQIKSLKEERDAAVTALDKERAATDIKATPRARFNALIEHIKEAETIVAAKVEAAEQIFGELKDSNLNASQRQQLHGRLTDALLPLDAAIAEIKQAWI